MRDLEWPLVGREPELEAIGDVLRKRSVVIYAPAGVGKSRLAREVVAAQETAGAFVQWVLATRSAATIPLGAFAGVLPAELGGDEPRQLIRRSADSLRERAGRRPIVLGVDDAQLLDPMSAALVLHLAGQDIRVVATIRTGEPVPDAIAALTKDLGAKRVDLAPLRQADVATLLDAVYEGPVEAAVGRWVEQASQGNPLYVRELVTGAMETASLRYSDGLWRLDGKPPLSSSLRDLIAARIATGPRTVLELLSLYEPLTVQELVALSSEDDVLDAEDRDLVAVDPADRVRLAHPLFGELAAATLSALRGRAMRRRLAETLRCRVPLTADDALRVARLLLDAGAEVPDELRLDAARAANAAGDPDLGAQLAEGSPERGLEATLLLARAHMLRNRDADAESVLAAAEDLCPDHPQAFEYLRQRTWNLTWGLHRLDETLALIDRALDWSDDGMWSAQVGLLRRLQTAVTDGFSALADIEAVVADPSLPASERLIFEGYWAQTALYSGDGETAAAVARRIRPTRPLRSLAESIALGASTVVPLESGLDWPSVEPYMEQTLRAAVRAGDHEGAGASSFTLAGLHFLRGRYRDAARWLAEAQLHYTEHDTFGSLIHVHAYQVGVAAATGDFEAATTGLKSIDTVLAGRPPLPNQLPYILRANGWATRLRGKAQAVDVFLSGARQVDNTPIFAAQLVYEALRADAEVAAPLRALADRCKAPMVAAYLAHADARARRSGPELLAASAAFDAIGALRYAQEAAADASATFMREGRQDSARRAAVRARELHAPNQGTEPPTINGLDAAALELSPREEQIVGLARDGLSNAEIAERLVLAVRTVESHLYRAMQKLGINDRRQF